MGNATLFAKQAVSFQQNSAKEELTMQTKQFLIFGRVQGVGFRFFTWQQAQKIGLSGTVRNREDGSVEVIAQGSEKQLTQLKQWLLQGSRFARVENIIEQEYLTDSLYQQFRVIQ
ncbi:Acylphosphatase [Bibersteinia trehalosi USDA-ARS-USMARC-190]|uniref:acylphosphatase n=2 Tax=Bibersteinia trehalosi TaxID=47735 RepID=W0R6K3_BIBTR|nr:Acylphosphatase [Bibersteinia trehalosi USDA-ARS-USMARC-190]